MSYTNGAKVVIHWDDEANIWVGICDELGISLESGSYDALIEKIRIVSKEMMEMNKIDAKTIEIFTDKRLLYA